MLFEEDSNRKSFKELCCSLLAIMIGFASCSVMSVLIYVTYETIIGNISYCTLWTDIPGRLAIFSVFYYGAAICGILPIPESLRINCLPQPFIVYKLESWKRFFRNLRLLLCCFNCHTREGRAETETSPLRDGSNERYYDPHPISRVQSDRIPIANTDTSQKFSGRLIKTEIKRDVESAHSIEEGSLTFDSAIGGFLVPRMRGKAAKRHYLSDSSSAESSGESRNSSTEALCESAPLHNKEENVAEVQGETGTPTHTETPLQSFPRFPWGLLKHRNGLPGEAKALHKKNLMLEKQELEIQDKKEKSNENADKESEHGRKTDSDEYNPCTNRPLRLTIVPKKGKTAYRGRTKTTPDSIRTLEEMNVPTHKRTISITAPHVIRTEATNVNLEPEVSFGKTEKDQYCKDSPDLQLNVDRIQKDLKSGQSFQDDSNEASTSGQDSNVLPSKNNEPEETSVQIEGSEAEPRLKEYSEL